MAESLRFQFVKQGGPSEVVAVQKPAVEAEDDVLIKVKAVALQPLDWKQLYWAVMVEKWPHALGLDLAGVVEQVGSSVTRFKPGDEVFGLAAFAERGVAYQEYAAVPEAKLAKKPEALTFEEVASIGCGFGTAIAGIYNNLQVPFSFLPELKEPHSPKSILVLGGSSAVGAAAIQLLRIALPDATVLATSSSKHHDRLSALGANKSFERTAGPEDVRAATPNGKGVDVVFDAVSGAALQPAMLDAFDAAGPKVLAEVFTGTNLEKEKIPDGIHHTIIMMVSVLETPGLFKGLGEIMATGKYKVPIAPKVIGEGLGSIDKGIQELKEGVSGTKLIVKL